MSAIIILDLKNSPKINNLLQDVDNILNSRGFRVFSENPRIYYNDKNVQNTSVQSAVKMIKQSEFFTVTVKKLQYTTQFKQ